MTALVSTMAELLCGTALPTVFSLASAALQLIKTALVKMEHDRASYQHTVQNFRNTYAVVRKQGRILQSNLDTDQIDGICQEYRRKLNEQLFTIGLMRMMQQLFNHFEKETDKIMGFTNQIKGLVDSVYISFHEKYGFAKLSPPPFSLARFSDHMLQLKQGTIAFCASPATVMQPQAMVIRKFYDILVAEAKKVFQQVSTETDNWLNLSLLPLTMQLKEHEEMLDRLLDSLRKITENVRALETRTRELERLKMALHSHVAELEDIRQALLPPEASADRPSQPSTAPHATESIILSETQIAAARSAYATTA